jgi:hypothetical protein
MSPGAMTATVVLDDRVSAALANVVQRIEAAAALAETPAPTSTAAALLGAVGALAELERPIPRRALLFPWLARGRGRA